jgi:hypothetical protein
MNGRGGQFCEKLRVSPSRRDVFLCNRVSPSRATGLIRRTRPHDVDLVTTTYRVPTKRVVRVEVPRIVACRAIAHRRRRSVSGNLPVAMRQKECAIAG